MNAEDGIKVPSGSVRLAEVYDYDTGKLDGQVGPRGRFVSLAADPAVEAASSKTERGGESGLLTDAAGHVNSLL